MRSATPIELYGILRDLVSSDHPVAKITVWCLIIFFLIPIIGGILILLIEGRPKTVISLILILEIEKPIIVFNKSLIPF